MALLLLPSVVPPSSGAAAEAEAGTAASPFIGEGEAASPPWMLPLEPVSIPPVAVAAAVVSGAVRDMRRARRPPPLPPLLVSPAVRGAERGTPRRRRLWLVRLLLQLRRSSEN